MIVGAGLAGLICGHAFPGRPIIEAAPRPDAIHKALLRFRSTAVADLVGIEFRAVTVRKGIWYAGAWQQPAIDMANLYSQKVVGRIMDRSIWNLDPVTRYIAPEDLHERLVTAMDGRIQWGQAYAPGQGDGAVISTAPMPIMIKEHGIGTAEQFVKAPITVQRFRVDDCDVHQTVYFPSHTTPLYRASITGDLLIVELIDEVHEDAYMPLVEAAFGIARSQCMTMGKVGQQYGKIAPIDERERQRIICTLTDDWGLFSVGRFATWRNILLDDVVHDISVVKRLLTTNAYERRLGVRR